MAYSTVWLDGRLFSDEVVVRTAHRYSNSFSVEIRSADDQIGVVLTPRPGVEPPADVEARFRDDALDERLRESVRQETQAIHAALIRAALQEATPGAMDLVG